MPTMCGLEPLRSTSARTSDKDVDEFLTDDFLPYKRAAESAPRLKAQDDSARLGIYVQGDVHTNTVESAFSLLKRGVLGTWHRISAKHLQAYCDEMCFRFNNRKNPYLLITLYN